MAKIVVRSKQKGGAVYVVEHETKQERSDRIWVENYKLLLEFIREFGHQKFPADKDSPIYTPEWVKLSQWAGQQRRAYFNNTIEIWRYNELVKVDFIFDPYDTYWNNSYQELLKFKEKYGHCNISERDKDYLILGDWVTKQRYRKHKLTEERLKLLEDIGFEWGIKRNPWEDMYQWLKEYYEEHGTTFVIPNYKKSYAEDKLKSLTRWCAKQTYHYKRGRLSQYKIDKLKELNYDFDRVENTLDNFWENKIQQLLDFKNQFGHLKIHSRNGWTNLYNWVRRIQKNPSSITEEQRKRLEEIGLIL